MSGSQVLALTGASGYVGSRLAAALSRAFLVVPMGRRAGADGILWSFHQTASCAETLRKWNVKVLVHAAWDFNHPQPEKNWAANVEGSRRLLDAAQAAGVEQVVFISTISAFAGAQSAYGKSKLAVEEMVRSLPEPMQGTVVRPGLVWGEQAGGMFGSLRGQAQKGGIVPILGDGRLAQYLLHEEDLAQAVRQICRNKGYARACVTAAHPQPWLLRDLILCMAAAAGTSIRFVGMPWRLVYAGLKGAEMLGMKLAFRSDSVISLVRQNPRPTFSSEFSFREFR